MLKIDGSKFEGGGQIVRTAVALSAMNGIPVEVDRIRESRKNPGLGNQHCAAVRAVAESCGAEVTGNYPGSRSLMFVPGLPGKSTIAVDVGTAGSITLVIQAWLPVALEYGGFIEIRGGTEVPFSPTIDYLEKVFLPALGSLRRGITLDVVTRGYYPRGGGLVKVSVERSRPQPLALQGDQDRGIRSCSAGLPDHVAERQASAAVKVLDEVTARSFPVRIERSGGPGTGSSCTAWEGSKGASSLGRRGLSAEKVGQAAARDLAGELANPGKTDRFLCDQLLIYLGRYGGGYTSETFTMHARTVVWILGMFGMPVEVILGNTVEFRG